MFSSFFAQIATNIVLITITQSPQFISLENKQKGTNKFYCGTLENEYAIKVVTPSGTKNLSVIGNWASASGWTPRKRCQIIAARFQKYYDLGILKYMRAGEVNSHPVICVVDKTQGPCNKYNVLITLEKHVSPEISLSELKNPNAGIRSRSGTSSSSELQEQLDIPSSSSSILLENGRFFIDIEKLIEERPVENDTNWFN